MRSIAVLLLTLTSLAEVALCQEWKDWQMFRMTTQVKSGQNGKDRFDKLQITPYFSGVSEQYALLAQKPAQVKKENGKPAVAFFYPTGDKRSGGGNYSHLWFDFRTYANGPEVEVPRFRLIDDRSSWALMDLQGGRATTLTVMSNFVTEPSGAFYADKGLLQFDVRSRGSIQFGGWMVCEWWKHSPQIFMRLKNNVEKAPTPASCADINIKINNIPLPVPTTTPAAAPTP
ncbi:Hypothetical protein D9617_13g101240 [Elsinoe fawcettii]|nr:Hypothetical protein D9617_13g101240 [Elsinoe fawcettii]